MLFVGSVFNSEGGSQCSIGDQTVSFVLSFSDGGVDECGPVFGAARGLCGHNKAPLMLAGQREHQTSISLRVISEELQVVFDVALGDVQGQRALLGSWTDGRANTRGSLVLIWQQQHQHRQQMEKEEEKNISLCHRTYAYRGEAACDESLRAFLIPSNPIRWVLSISEGDGSIIGAGMFDDSADVPGRSTLHFSLTGHVDAEGRLLLLKVYELAPQTEGVYVCYSGKLLPNDVIEGTWRNAKSGAFGPFRAHPMDSRKSPHIRLCDECCRMCAPGQLRWCNPADQRVICDMCKEDGRLELIPSTQHLVHVASGPCVSHLLWNALSKFPRYAPLKRDCLKVVQVIRRDKDFAQGSTVAIVGETRDRLMSVGIVAGFLAGAVVAAVPLGFSEEILQGLNPAVTLDFTAIRAAIQKPPHTGEFALPHVRSSSELSAILFSSGTTGTPKQVRFTEELLMPTKSGMSLIFPYRRVDFQSFDPSFIVSLITMMHYGGERYASSPETLFEDLTRLQPTHLGAPPTVWNELYAEYVARGANIEAAAHVKQMLGRCLKVATCGGAALSPVVQDFVQRKLDIDLSTLYASRECGSIAKNGKIFPGVSVIIVDGEICVNSSRIVLSAPSVFRNGKQYVRTGDTGQLSSDGRRLTVSGRVGSAFKSEDGLFVSPETVESLIEQSVYVKHAVLMPTMEVIVVPRRACSRHQVLANIRVLLGRHHPSPTNILLLPIDEPWGDLMTTSGKKRRAIINKRYQQQLNELPGLPPAEASERRGDFFNLLTQLFPDVQIHSTDVTLPQLGLSSIAIARIRASGLQVSARVLYSCTIAEIDELCKGGAVEEATVLRSAQVDYKVETRDISAFESESFTKHNGTGQDILLIGGTGFLGPFLVSALAARYESRNIYVLCRRETPKELPANVSIVLGDVTRPSLGLSEEVLDRLNLGIVIHSAARVHSQLSYADLKSVNVEGSLRAAALAHAHKAKFCFVSSIAAIGDFEAKNGYGQSKAIAEALLLRLAREKGFRLCTILRIGSISCTLEGAGRPDDVIWTIIRVSKEIGAAPDRCLVQLNWIPVDFVARSIAVCTNEEQSANVIGHGPEMAKIFDCLKVDRISVEEWRRRVKSHLGDSPTRDILLAFDFESAGVGAHLLPRHNVLNEEWPVYSNWDWLAE